MPTDPLTKLEMSKIGRDDFDDYPPDALINVIIIDEDE